MEREKNMILMANQFLKENIEIGKDMEKEKNMIEMANQFLKENI